ncbi:hypothetical protein [Mesorhizobium sp. M2A.F.Ca.ET.046.03.2.1]|uniref:hypothetical protein n=1 Tax=Mesorhizobium sp. M2A.F.Ca.ET.046.03.2.1 TaxID=2493674 RepID=UPI001FDF8DC0|nr:hypothetical protein [Mesorhizobium sp. M2A.F.Ca.ET.046.03.2.1]
MEPQMRDFFAECDKAPRLNEMADFFSATAAAQSGVPIKMPSVDARLFQGDVSLESFTGVHRQLWGRFDPHYLAVSLIASRRRFALVMPSYGMDLPLGMMKTPLASMCWGTPKEHLPVR